MSSAITAGAVDCGLTPVKTAVCSGFSLLTDIRVNTPEAMFEVLERRCARQQRERLPEA